MKEKVLLSEILRPSLTLDQMAGRNILMATDFSECSMRALDFALAIASRYQSQLYLFHCVDPTTYNFLYPGAIQTTLVDARRELERQVSDLRREDRTKDVEIKVIVDCGDLAAMLSHAVKDLDPALIVVGTHGRTGWRKMVLGSVAEMIIDHVCCPVLCVGPCTDRTRTHQIRLENILLAGEGSARASLARSYAFSLACKYRSRLTTVDVLENRLGRVRAEVSRFEWQEQDANNDAMDNTPPSPLELPAEIDTESDLILQVADRISADLIVLAVPETHRFTNRFSSSDPYKVVSSAACPVLTVSAR